VRPRPALRLDHVQRFSTQHRFAQGLGLRHDVHAELRANAFDEIIERVYRAGPIAGLVACCRELACDIFAERIGGQQALRERDRLAETAFAAVSVDERFQRARYAARNRSRSAWAQSSYTSSSRSP
jgi:hypothetical protein